MGAFSSDYDGVMSDMDQEVRSSGWDAITAACDRIYTDQPTPAHAAPPVSARLGGDDPIEGISVYRAIDPLPHWHYVTYGYSDLFEPAVPGQEFSGYGMEMTFRLASDAAQDLSSQPPLWPMDLLQNVARYVFSTGNVFAPGHFINANGPISLDDPTELVALGFVADPDLGSIVTPNGQVRFVQAVGLTADEMELGSAWNMSAFLELLTEQVPRGVTDLVRSSILADPNIHRQVTDRIAHEGSSVGILFCSVVNLKLNDGVPRLTLSASAATAVARALPGRLPFRRWLELVGDNASVLLIPGEEFSADVAGERPTLTLAATQVEALAGTITAEPGDYLVPGTPLQLRVIEAG